MKLIASVIAAMLALTNGEYIVGRTDLTNAFIDREYIATATVSSGACDTLKDSILAERVKIQGVERSARDGALSQAKIGQKCFITFKGDATLREQVQAMAEIDAIEPNMFVQTAAASWGLDRVDQADLPLDDSFSTTHTGKGVTVFVIDTGIYASHSDFGGRAQIGGDFVNENNKEDGNGHGTHCAGTVGSNTYGIATDATLVGVKVLSASGSGTNSGVLNGIQWAVDNAPKASVLSMSLGGGSSTAMNNAVLSASDAGHIVVVAAGNDNKDACNVSPAGAGGNGASGSVITVTSSTSSDGRSSFSNYGSCTDMFAPGSSITSTWIGGSSATKTISGTSMATPHVAGVAATLMEKHNFDKTAAINELFTYYAKDKISDARGPNKLLQATYNGKTAPPSSGPTNPPPTPPPTNPPGCWFCWWDRESSTAGNEAPAPAPAPAATSESSIPLIVGIAGSCVGLAGIAAGVVISRRKKTSDPEGTVNPMIDL